MIQTKCEANKLMQARRFRKYVYAMINKYNRLYNANMKLEEI